MEILMLTVGFAIAITLVLLGFYNRSFALVLISATILIPLGLSVLMSGVQTKVGIVSNVETWANNTTGVEYSHINETNTLREYEGIDSDILGICLVFAGIAILFMGVMAVWQQAGFT